MTLASELESALTALAAQELDAEFAVSARIVPAYHEIGPAEARVVVPPQLANAAAGRQSTFAAGRACAHDALDRLDASVDAIPIGHAGAPVWPSGVVGSITHTRRIAAAIVVRSPPVAGIGLDIEDASGVDDAGMVRLICRPEEDLQGADPADPARLRHGKLVFVIKEAVYKVHSPLGGEFLDFQEVLVTLRGDCFSAEIIDVRKQGAAGSPIRGRILLCDDWIAAIAVCTRSVRPWHRAGTSADG